MQWSGDFFHPLLVSAVVQMITLIHVDVRTAGEAVMV